MAERPSLDWAKSKGDYKNAANAAYEELRELFEEEPESFNSHLLTGIYVDEIVRNVSVDLMQSGGYSSPAQLGVYLREFIKNQDAPQQLLDVVDMQLTSSLQKFSKQLTTLSEIAEIIAVEGHKEPSRLPVAGLDFHVIYNEPECRDLANGNVELACVPNAPMILDPDLLSQEFNELSDVSLPLEIHINGLTFMVDYNGGFYSYESEVSLNILENVAAALSHRLARCLIQDS
jgi:hypothetical protein